jgi:hypothetical protein
MQRVTPGFVCRHFRMPSAHFARLFSFSTASFAPLRSTTTWHLARALARAGSGSP